jgi:hypothetical protein
MKSVLNLSQVFDLNNLRRTYVEALKFHENNSDSIIALKVSKFTSPDNFKMVQNEPPVGFLRRLQKEADFINSMTPADEVPPITDRMLSTKFLDMVKRIDYLNSAVRTYEVGYIDQYGQSRQHSLDRYAQLLQNIYQERKDKSSYSARDHYHSNHRGYSLQDHEYEEDFGLSFKESDKPKDSKRICYSFRDTGECSFGSNCRFEHVKGKFTPKPQHKANFSNEAFTQYMENVKHESALQMKEFKKKFVRRYNRSQDKMLKYKQQLKEKNSKGSKERAAVAQESEDEKAAVAKEKPEEEAGSSSEDDVSDLSALEDDDDDN